MEREIDLTPRHLVDWLKADRAGGGRARLEVRATREFLCEDAPAAAEGLDAEDGSVPDGPEEMPLDQFEICFLAHGDPQATITVETGTTAERRSFERVFARILARRPAVRQT